MSKLPGFHFLFSYEHNSHPLTQARVGANGMEGLSSPSSLSDALNPQSVAGCMWVPFDSVAGENHSCSDPRNDFQIKAFHTDWHIAEFFPPFLPGVEDLTFLRGG